MTTVLAEAEVSIFAISTFDTDYILVKSEKLPFAQAALMTSGYIFSN
ncbi:MAG: ACT domain-containing protein [Desulfobulbaceae bacterium]|nr:ACT domain-containing protein [Desulfobulbaceae bacterium]